MKKVEKFQDLLNQLVKDLARSRKGYVSAVAPQMRIL